ncbi:MAG: NUDIX hydrolase [Anaerolineae bacterium]|nr:NUDIX hydrolase [Anaerolineae bacterium]
MADRIKVRATAVLIENEHILLVEQRVSDRRKWSLPGGTLEAGETLEQCLLREMREETGLTVSLERLLYVCDRIEPEVQVLHITFAVKRLGGQLTSGSEPEPDASPIYSVHMAPLAQLEQYGFSPQFCALARADLAGSGTYQGPIANIGL